MRTGAQTYKRGVLTMLIVLAAIVAGGVLQHAWAAPRISTETLYYEVRGDTSGELLSYMLRHGPRGESGRALGTTSAILRQDSEFVEGSNCRLRNFYVELEMTLRLPRLQEGVQLSGATRRNWNRFVNYVTRHENRHVAIYKACARRIDRRVRALNGTMSCSALRSQMRAIFNEENRRCDREHTEYDAGETSRIQNHPFVVQALNNSERNQTASRRQSQSRESSQSAGAGGRVNSIPIEDLR